MAATKIAGWLTAAGMLAAAPGLALAQGTEAQREACMPDAFRLCSSYIPDAGRIETCLRNAGPRLSSACYAVFNPPMAAPNRMQTARMPSPPPRGIDADDE